ncbi:MAG TPA: Gmad2 immunoglobulin-like domain-containing protein [Egibacteraceae bacterium]|nr:Gmad2 immunoglobulin-like domain-containing protein [Egibacteraceae bacterium]
MQRLTWAAMTAALLLALAGCGQRPATVPDGEATATTPAGDDATAEPTPTDASPTETDASPTETDPSGAVESTAFFVVDAGGRLVLAPETHELAEPTVAVARAAMEQLVAAETLNPSLVTMAPDGTEVLGVNISGSLLTVDLSEAVRDGSASGSAGEAAFAQQLAHTAAQFDGVESVELRVEGQPVTELWGHLDWSAPIEPDLFALSPVTIDSPQWGESVAAGPVSASGEANTFEATVELRLIAPDGSVAEETFTTATSGSGERGTWEHTFSAAADSPGTWAVEAIEPDPSGGEGNPPVTFRVEFEVNGS